MDASRIQQLLGPCVPQPLSDAQLEQVRRYLDLLIRWNQRMNLTAIRDPEQIVTRHFGESLFAASRLFPTGEALNARIADLGSGAGFPGLAIRIYAPALITLVESRQRKAAFLREAVRVLGFDGVEVFHGRAEAYAPAASSGGLIVTLRAVEKFEQALPMAASILTSYERRCVDAGVPFSGNPLPSGRLAILIGAEQVAQAIRLVPEISWAAPLLVPESRSRVLLVGEAPKLD